MKIYMKKLFDILLRQRFIFILFFMIVLELEATINHAILDDLIFRTIQNLFILFVFLSVFQFVGLFFQIVLFAIFTYVIYDLLIALISLFMRVTGKRIHRDFVDHLCNVYGIE